MKHLQKNFEVSERRACRVLGQPRSKSTLHLYKGRHRHGSLAEDGCSLQREPALRLPESVGASQEGGLDGEQEACPEGMEGSGSNGPIQRV